MDKGKSGRLEEKDLVQIPSLYDLQWAFRHLNKAKAAGLDGLGAEVYQANLCQTSIRLYSLFLKMTARRQWVTEMSGGWLLPLWKGKNNPQDMVSYRGIMLEPTIARGFSRAWRGCLSAGLSEQSEPNQWGGRPGLSCTALHLQLKLHQATAKHQGWSQALIFVDFKAAFYSVAKPLLCGNQYDHDQFLKVCDMMRVPATAREAFAQNIVETNAVWSMTKSNMATSMTTATLSKTWYAIPNGSTTFAPLTGSRPGDPLADLFFGAIMRIMLSKIHDRCYEEELFDCSDRHAVGSSVTWVDDIAFVINGDAETICNKAMHLLAIILDITTEYGFELSVGQGKTAAMVTFRGPQARKIRVQTEKAFTDGLPVLTEHRQVVKVPLVHYYKHLGGFLNRQGTVMQELKVRIGQTMMRMVPLRKVFKDQRIDLKHKRTLMKTMAWPVLSLHTGCWWGLTEGEYKAWQGAWHRVTSVLYPRDRDGQVQKVQMHQRAYDLECPMPMEMMLLQRLRLFAHVLQENDVFMTGIICANHEIMQDASWLASVHKALKWMQQQIGCSKASHTFLQIHNEVTWQEAVAFSRKLKKMIIRAQKAHHLRLRACCDVHNAEKWQSQMLKEAGWWKDDPCEHQQQDVPQHVCQECGFQAASQAALAVHEHRKHGSKSAIRRFLEDGVCRFCKKQYHTRPRLLQHVQSSAKGCWYRMMRGCEPMDQETMEQLDTCDKEKGVAFHQKAMKGKKYELACRPCTEEEMISRLIWRQEPQHVPDDPPTPNELAEWSQYGFLPPGQGGRQITVRQKTEFQVPNVMTDVHDYEKSLCSDLVRWETAPDFVPFPLVQDVKYFLIFFAGHRRPGDISDWLQKESNIVPVAIDTAVSEEFGNVYKDALWTNLI